LNLLNVSNFTNESATSFGDINFTPDDMTITVGSITSIGPTIPPLVANGFDATPDFGHDNPGNGGMVTLDLTNGNLTVGSESDLNYISANGGLFAVDSAAGGNGGTVNIMATGDVTLNDGDDGVPAISATTGFIPQNGPFTLGEGGTVNIDASGTITVNSTIVVSSDEIPKFRPSGSTPAGRRSASGGNISLTSHNSGSPLTQNVVAINLGDSSQLLSLLDSDAPGPGGAITILATGANSDANINGEVEADRGTIDIRNNGNSGRVLLGSMTSSVFMRADVIKAGAFGTNGQLIVGSGFLSADSILKLYAPGSNGEINFVADVTLSSGSATILAGDTITIQPTHVVTISGNGGPAQIFTNNANYSGFGGTNPDNGTFGGNGANNPQPLSSAPPFDTNPVAPSVTSHPHVAGHPPRRIVHSPNPSVVQGRPPRSVARPGAGGDNRPPRIVRVRDSDELISLIERTTHGDSGHVAPRDATRTNDRPNPTGTNVAGPTSIVRRRADIGNSFSPSINRLP
jgi:hypothetical protein